MVSGDYASEVTLGFPTAKRLCVLLGRNCRDGTWWYRGKLGTVLRLVWCTALYWASEVAYHVALLKVQAEGALLCGEGQAEHSAAPDLVYSLRWDVRGRAPRCTGRGAGGRRPVPRKAAARRRAASRILQPVQAAPRSQPPATPG